MAHREPGRIPHNVQILVQECGNKAHPVAPCPKMAGHGSGPQCWTPELLPPVVWTPDSSPIRFTNKEIWGTPPSSHTCLLTQGLPWVRLSGQPRAVTNQIGIRQDIANLPRALPNLPPQEGECAHVQKLLSSWKSKTSIHYRSPLENLVKEVALCRAVGRVLVGAWKWKEAGQAPQRHWYLWWAWG